jgi:tetratricopeptide (TPR) repeat protein
MIDRTTQNLDPFSEFIRLLLRLHRLIAEGQGDSDEAEEIRDQMDYPWRRLNPEQRTLAEGLSADLYTLRQDRPPPASPPEDPAWSQIAEAIERREWRTTLDALRACEAQLPPAQVAYIRAACWVYLEQFDPAIEFLYERERLQPLDAPELVLLLNCLMAAQRLPEAETRSQAIRSDEPYAPLLLAAGTVLSLRATRVEPDYARQLRVRAVELLEQGVRDAESSPDPVSPHEQLAACLHLGANYKALGDKAGAIPACTQALRQDPDNLDALVLHAWLVREDQPETGQREFEKGYLNGLAPPGFESPPASSLIAH